MSTWNHGEPPLKCQVKLKLLLNKCSTANMMMQENFKQVVGNWICTRARITI
jgi:hypothetical protein